MTSCDFYQLNLQQLRSSSDRDVAHSKQGFWMHSHSVLTILPPSLLSRGSLFKGHFNYICLFQYATVLSNLMSIRDAATLIPVHCSDENLNKMPLP